MTFIEEYILTDKNNKPIYRTFDLVDLAKKIITLNNEIIYINRAKNYEDIKVFDYRLLIEKHKIEDLEKE